MFINVIHYYKYIILESCLGSILMVNIRYLNKDFIFELYLSLKMLTKTGSLKILSGTDSLIFEKKISNLSYK